MSKSPVDPLSAVEIGSQSHYFQVNPLTAALWPSTMYLDCLRCYLLFCEASRFGSRYLSQTVHWCQSHSSLCVWLQSTCKKRSKLLLLVQTQRSGLFFCIHLLLFISARFPSSTITRKTQQQHDGIAFPLFILIYLFIFRCWKYYSLYLSPTCGLEPEALHLLLRMNPLHFWPRNYIKL